MCVRSALHKHEKDNFYSVALGSLPTEHVVEYAKVGVDGVEVEQVRVAVLNALQKLKVEVRDTRCEGR